MTVAAAATAPPVVFIHGMWSTPATFDGLRAVLEARGIATHAPALPFHDRDPALPPPPELGSVSVEDYLTFLAAEVARLPTPPVIAGHSMGGFLAQALAARVGAPGLVLFSPAATAATNVPALDPVRTLAGVVTKGGWWRRPTLIDAGRARWGIYNEVPPEIATEEIGRLVWDSGHVLYELALPFVARTGAATVDYGRLTMPTLIVVGNRDRITPAAIARATARKVAGRVDYHELPGVGHWLFWGGVEAEVAALTGEWLGTLT